MKIFFMKGIRNDDMVECFSCSSGPGGQHINKVSTAVTLKHFPTGIRVTVSDSRSQARNRIIARTRLTEKITKSARNKILTSLAEIARNRRRKSQRSRRNKTRLVESKRRRSEIKKMRSAIHTTGG